MKNFTANDLYHHFQDFHDPVPSILQQTKDEELIWNDIIDLQPIDKYAFENIVLIGDAAHATLLEPPGAQVPVADVAADASARVAHRNAHARRSKLVIHHRIDRLDPTLEHLTRKRSERHARGPAAVLRADADEVRSLLERLPVSLELGLMTLVCALLLAIPIGILAAVRRGVVNLARHVAQHA